MTGPAAIDLEEARKRAAGMESMPSSCMSGDATGIRALIAAVEALRERVAELEALKLYVQHTDNMNDMVLLGLARDASEAHATEMAAAINALLKERTVNILEEAAREYPHGKEDVAEVLGVFDNVRTALASTPAAALERARARDDVVCWAREIARAGHVVWPQALRKLDALDQGAGT